MTELEKAIRGQVRTLSDVLERDLSTVTRELEVASFVRLVGTGTSQHAAELGKQMLSEAGIRATWESAAGFARRRWQPYADELVVLITHTGETAFARAVRERAIHENQPLVALTAEGVDWPESVSVAPREHSETYTSSYTAVLLAMARIAGELGAPDFTPSALRQTVEAVAEALEQDWSRINPPQRLLVVAGSGPAGVTAREAALKIREAAGLLCEGYEDEYLLHGSAVPLVTEDRLLLLRSPREPDDLLTALGDAAASEGIEVCSLEEPAPLDPLLAQIPLTTRLQLLASAFAQVQERDPDTVIRGAWADNRLWEVGGPS